MLELPFLFVAAAAHSRFEELLSRVWVEEDEECEQFEGEKKISYIKERKSIMSWELFSLKARF